MTSVSMDRPTCFNVIDCIPCLLKSFGFHLYRYSTLNIARAHRFINAWHWAILNGIYLPLWKYTEGVCFYDWIPYSISDYFKYRFLLNTHGEHNVLCCLSIDFLELDIKVQFYKKCKILKIHFCTPNISIVGKYSKIHSRVLINHY